MPQKPGSVYIEDGCTISGYVAEIARLHGEVRFTYRPLAQLERVTTQKKMSEVSAAQGEKIAAETMRRRLVDWDVTNNGRDVPIETAEILRLQPMLYQKMYLIVFGQIPSDVDPNESPEDCNVSAEVQVQQIFDESSLVAVVAGNSDGQSG